jgi:arylsulfatase A-like enzyme
MASASTLSRPNSPRKLLEEARAPRDNDVQRLVNRLARIQEYRIMRALTPWLVLVSATVAFTPISLAQAGERVTDKPNVLFIAIDDLRDWVHYLGYDQVKTPNLDRLAARGVTFTRSYCAAPVCNPSRTALLTGLRPSTSGVYDNGTDWRETVSDEFVTLPLHFKNNGYYVAGAGKIYHDSYRRESDWHDYLNRRGGAADPENPAPAKNKGKAKAKAKAARENDDGGVGGIRFKPLDCDDDDMVDYQSVSYVLKKLNEERDEPFFLACGLHKPHMGWDVPRKYYDMYPLHEIQLPKVLETDLEDVPPAGVKMARPQGDHAAIVASGRWKDAVQGYLAAITFCDAMIGRLIDGFDQCPRKDDTIIVLWSDHGWHLGEKQHWRKFALWEEATRSPLVWIVPGVTKPDSVCNRTVDFMHIYPTLCDLTGIEPPKHLEGPSIRPLLADPGGAWDRPAVTTYLHGNHAVRTARWRYIRYHDGGEELYDEAADPLEWTNLADKPEHAAVKSELAQWLPKTNAPPRRERRRDAGVSGSTGNENLRK